MNEPGRSRAFGHAARETAQDWLTPEYSRFAVALIARQLQTTVLSQQQYAKERERLLAQDDAHWLHGRKLHLPTVDQVTASRSWALVLSDAGLSAPEAGAGSPGRKAAPPRIVEVLERCYQAYGVEPTCSDLEMFARSNGIPFPRRHRAWSSYVSEWKDKRRSEGLVAPEKPPPTSQRPDYAITIGAALPHESRAKDRHDFEQAVAWVMRYLSQLAPGQTSSQRGYSAWARKQPETLYASALQRHHGGWSKVRDEAHERLRQEAGQKTTPRE